MKEESDAANAQSVLTPVTASDRLTANAATAEQEASATASLLRHIMQIGPARPAVLPEAGGQSKDGQAAASAADRPYLQTNSTNTNGWREHASRFSVVILQTNTRY